MFYLELFQKKIQKREEKFGKLRREREICMREKGKKEEKNEMCVKGSAKRYRLIVWEQILFSNHVQSDNEDDVCALKSNLLHAFAHVHYSKFSDP
jgi:hypothetical protein